MADGAPLDALERLAALEHALLVDHLVSQCALGHDLDESEGGPATDSARDAASRYGSGALSHMFHLARVNGVLVQAGRSPVLTRADAAPVHGEQVAEMLSRQEAAASALDREYEALESLLGTPGPLPPDVVEEIRSLSETGRHHAEDFAGVAEALQPTDVLRATRRTTEDPFEQRLLDTSDGLYRMVVSALRDRFGNPDEFASAGFRQVAVTGMLTLDDLNRALVQRGLLPPFSAP